MTKNKFKYHEMLDDLASKGCLMPPLFEPNNMKACRFAFSASGRINHIPQYVSNPRRMLDDLRKGKGNTSLLALSCFATAPQAELFYNNLRKAFKNADQTIGDSLAEGKLTNEDGLKTIESPNGHFDFYEYENCDLNKSFKITKRL